MSKSGVRAVVAEDEEFIRLLLIEALDEAGFEILEARNGHEALRLIDDPDGIQVIVSDINMPGYSGFDLAQRLREVHPGVPVIPVSGRPDQLRGDPLSQPFRSFFEPFKTSAIVEAVRDSMEERERLTSRET